MKLKADRNPQIISSGVLGIWFNANSGYDKIRQDTLHLMSATICKYHLLLSDSKKTYLRYKITHEIQNIWII